LQINNWKLRMAVALAAGAVMTGPGHAQQSTAVGVVQVEGELHNYTNSGVQRASGSLQQGGFELRSSADLATGALKAYASGNRPGDGMATGSAGATFAESLWFSGAAVGTYVGELKVSFEATLTADAGYEASWGGISALTNLAVSTVPGQTQMRFFATDCSAITLPCTEGGTVQAALSLPLVITSTDFAGRGSVGISATLQASAVAGGIADVGNTVHLSLALLPAYQSYASASGVFLTAVPEPSTPALLLGGLLAVGIAAQARRARCRAAS
jgi:energy-converting hydrogenase Eha subunit B